MTRDVFGLLLLGLLAQTCLCLQTSRTLSQPLPDCAVSSSGSLHPSSTCALDVAKLGQALQPGQLQLAGAGGPTLPTVLVRAPSGFAGLPGLQSVAVSNVILESTDTFPNHAIDLATLLRPPHLAAGTTAVNLTNVVLLHTVTAAQAAVAVATLRGVVSDPIVQQGISTWTLQLYTDLMSYAYVASFSSPGLSCNGCGVFLRFAGTSSGGSDSSGWDQPTTTPDEPRPAVNYLLGVDNSTFIPSLLRYGSLDTPRPFLVMLSSNITWGRHPLLRKAPGGIMELNRPVVLLGQTGVLTGLDLGMVPNLVHVTGAYSNLTLHGLVLENMGFGDRLSGTTSAGLSIVNPANLWLLYWPRQDIRFSLVNTTTVLPHQELVQYLIYWQIMTSSSDPAMRAEAAWVQRGPGITVWEAVVYSQRMLELKFVCRTSLGKDSWRVSTPLLFPQLPDNVDDPSLYKTGLKAHSAAPLAALAGDDRQLQHWLSTLSGLPREGLSVIISPSVSLGPDTASSWPPAGDIVLRAPKTVIIGQRVCEAPGAGSSSSSSESSSGDGVTISGHRAVFEQMPQRGLLEGLGMSAAAAAEYVQCDAVNHTDSTETVQLPPLVRLAHSPMLDWGQDTSLVQLQPSGASGVLELNSLTLVGLSQGQGVGARAEGAGSIGRRLAAAAPTQQLALPAAASSTSRGRQQRQPRALAAPSRALTAADPTAATSGGLTQGHVAVWTHVVWAVKRAANGQLVLNSVAMGLPRPEFERLLAASRAGAGGAFKIPLDGGGALTAKSSSYLDNCCLLVSSYSAPSMNATQLLLFADPDTSRSMPPGYTWPFDGSEGPDAQGTAGRRSHGGAGLGPAGLAGLVVGLCAAAALAGLLAWVLVAKRRRQRQQQYVQDAAGVFKPTASDGNLTQSRIYGYSGQDQYGSSMSSDVRGASAGAVLGPALTQEQKGYAHGYSQGYSQGLQQQQSGSQSGGTSGSGTGVGVSSGDAASRATGAGGSEDRRWHKLTSAISSKVQDIHQQRLRTALMQSKSAGAVSLGGAAAVASTLADRSTVLADGTTQSSSGASAQHNSSSQGTPVRQAGVAAAAGLSGSSVQQEQVNGVSAERSNTLELKELIGRGTFGTVYRASWQGATVAVKLLQLPPGTGRTMTESGMFSGSGGTAGLLRAVGGWSNAAATHNRNTDLLKHEHMAVQEAAIGSCMMHPNIVSVYSISLRPSGLAGPLAATQAPAASAGSSGGLLLLREDGTAVMGASELHAGGGPKPSAASLELLPWTMQLVMELCDQGTLREALDAGMLVNKSTGLHDIHIVLSLAHNVACAMAYLHQEHIIHGDLKASNVLLKTCVPAGASSSSSDCALQPSPSQPSRTRSSTAAGAPTTGSWSFGGHRTDGSSGQTPPALHPTAGASAASQQRVPPASPAAAAAAVGSQDGSAADAQCGPPASKAIIDAAAAADEAGSGMHSLLKCGWVVAKVSDFGLSMCVQPEETHVSSVHAGTLTHMAPEHLMHGRCSKASDVYAFGILLWEVATGGKAFAGIPKPLLGHCVVSQGMRPTWPSAMKPGGNSSSSSSISGGAFGGGSGSDAGSDAGPWSGLVALTERCWAQEAQARPSFAEVVQQLTRLLRAAAAAHATASAAPGPPGTSPPLPGAAAAAAAAAGSCLSSGPQGIVTPGRATSPMPVQAATSADAPAAAAAAARTNGGACPGPRGFGSSSNAGQQVGGEGQPPASGGPGPRSWFFSGLVGERQDAGSSVVSADGVYPWPAQTVVPLFTSQQVADAGQQQQHPQQPQ